MENQKIALKNFTEEELKEFMKEIGEKPFRGTQIYSWIYKGAKTFDDMKNIPKSLREKLEKVSYIGNLETELVLKSKVDKTKKYLFALNDGNIITGRSSELMGASAAAVLNAVKVLANIPDDMLLISPVILEPIIKLKTDTLGSRQVSLSLEEVLTALSICAVTNPAAQMAMDQLVKLEGAQAHSTTMLSKDDEQTFRKLGIDVTCEAVYPSQNLYYV